MLIVGPIANPEPLAVHLLDVLVDYTALVPPKLSAYSGVIVKSQVMAETSTNTVGSGKD